MFILLIFGVLKVSADFITPQQENYLSWNNDNRQAGAEVGQALH